MPGRVSAMLRGRLMACACAEGEREAAGRTVGGSPLGEY